MEKYEAEYAFIGYFECNICLRNVEANKVLISTKSNNQKFSTWQHAECFFSKNKEINLVEVKNFIDIRWSDIDEIITKSNQIRKRKRNESESESETDLDSIKKKLKLNGMHDELKNQNLNIWKAKDCLKEMIVKCIRRFLLDNNQTGFERDGVMRKEVIEAAADCLCFGALLPCDQCLFKEETGQIFFRSTHYECGSCQFKTFCPKRTVCVINEEFENLLAFKSFEIKMRILSSETQNADAELKKIGGEKRKERKIEGKIVKENNKDSKLSNETNNGDEEVETKEGEDNEEKKLKDHQLVKENKKDSKSSNETNNGDEEVETKEGEDDEEKKLKDHQLVKENKKDAKSSNETNNGDEGDKENKKIAENEELVKEKEQKSAGDKNEKNENEKVKCTLCNQFFFKKGIKAHVTRKHGNM